MVFKIGGGSGLSEYDIFQWEKWITGKKIKALLSGPLASKIEIYLIPRGRDRSDWVSNSWVDDEDPRTRIYGYYYWNDFYVDIKEDIDNVGYLCDKVFTSLFLPSQIHQPWNNEFFDYVNVETDDVIRVKMKNYDVRFVEIFLEGQAKAGLYKVSFRYRNSGYKDVFTSYGRYVNRQWI